MQAGIQFVETQEHEVTLLIDGRQAMQGWELDLMNTASDLLCDSGSEFLEIGLGLGLSARRIAHHPNTRRHVIVEMHANVVDHFRTYCRSLPDSTRITVSKFEDYISAAAEESFDGIFFDPFFQSSEQWEDHSYWACILPQLRRILRPRGVLIPCFVTRPILRPHFVDYFDRIQVIKKRYRAYSDTNYVPKTGVAYIQCFYKG